MAQKTTQLKFNQRGNGSLGLACEGAPTIDYINESVNDNLSFLMLFLLLSKHGVQPLQLMRCDLIAWFIVLGSFHLRGQANLAFKITLLK